MSRVWPSRATAAHGAGCGRSLAPPGHWEEARAMARNPLRCRLGWHKRGPQHDEHGQRYVGCVRCHKRTEAPTSTRRHGRRPLTVRTRVRLSRRAHGNQRMPTPRGRGCISFAIDAARHAEGSAPGSRACAAERSRTGEPLPLRNVRDVPLAARGGRLVTQGAQRPRPPYLDRVTGRRCLLHLTVGSAALDAADPRQRAARTRRAPVPTRSSQARSP